MGLGTDVKSARIGPGVRPDRPTQSNRKDAADGAPARRGGGTSESGRRLAVAGVSRQPGQAANAVLRKSRAAGCDVFAVNPSAAEVEGARRSGRAQCNVAALLAALWMAAPMPALPQGCDPRPQQSHFAMDNLRRAGSEADLAIAQDFADRARRELDQLASGAARCDCEPAQTRFEAAAAQLRQAREAESRRDLRGIVAKTVPLFDEAMAALKDCAGR